MTTATVEVAREVKFREGARVPKGVTVEGVLEERSVIVTEFGAATAPISARAVIADPARFPNLRAWGPEDPETAFRQAMERGVRDAYASIVILREEPTSRGETEQVEIRVFYAVPKEGYDDLSYEPLTLVRQEDASKRFIIAQLRRDASVFAARMRNTLAELEEMYD